MSAFTSLQVDSLVSYAIAIVMPALDAIFPVVPSETAVIALGVATAGSTDRGSRCWLPVPRLIIVCRFIPGGRTAVTPTCGLIGYDRRRFISALIEAIRRIRSRRKRPRPPAGHARSRNERLNEITGTPGRAPDKHSQSAGWTHALDLACSCAAM